MGGSVPAAHGVAPRVRVGHRWFDLLWLLPLGLFGMLVAVAIAQGLRETNAVATFIKRYPGAALTRRAGLPSLRSAAAAGLQQDHEFFGYRQSI